MQSETNREEILEEDKYLSRFYYTFGSNSLGQQPFSFGQGVLIILTMAQETEKAIQILIQAQRACKEMYL